MLHKITPSNAITDEIACPNTKLLISTFVWINFSVNISNPTVENPGFHIEFEVLHNKLTNLLYQKKFCLEHYTQVKVGIATLFTPNAFSFAFKV